MRLVAILFICSVSYSIFAKETRFKRQYPLAYEGLGVERLPMEGGFGWYPGMGKGFIDLSRLITRKFR